MNYSHKRQTLAKCLALLCLVVGFYQIVGVSDPDTRFWWGLGVTAVLSVILCEVYSLWLPQRHIPLYQHWLRGLVAPLLWVVGSFTVIIGAFFEKMHLPLLVGNGLWLLGIIIAVISRALYVNLPTRLEER
jgi:hypothetical protein